MWREHRGKLVFGGLILTAFAKAAVSFPVLPGPDNLNWFDGPTLQVKAESEEKTDPGGNDLPPPPVAGLTDRSKNCPIPEELLQSLTQERDLVDNAKRDLDARQAEIKLAMEKLSVEKASLLELRNSIEELLKQIEAQQTDDLKRLIAFYQNMKPAEAATIMNDMDIEVVIMVLGEMKPRQAAPILAKMTPVRARAVSKIILERSQLPGDQDLNGVELN